MTDIVERLRDPATSAITIEEAADEIERLRLRMQDEDLAAIVREQGFEIERLRTRYDSATDQAVRYADEIERLIAALQATVDAIVHVQKHLIHHSPPQDAVMNGALAIACRALEPKP